MGLWLILSHFTLLCVTLSQAGPTVSLASRLQWGRPGQSCQAAATGMAHGLLLPARLPRPHSEATAVRILPPRLPMAPQPTRQGATRIVHCHKIDPVVSRPVTRFTCLFLQQPFNCLRTLSPESASKFWSEKYDLCGPGGRS